MIRAQGWNMSLWGIFGYGPTWEFYCTKCGEHWRKELPRVNYPKVKCPGCGDIEKLQLIVR